MTYDDSRQEKSQKNEKTPNYSRQTNQFLLTLVQILNQAGQKTPIDQKLVIKNIVEIIAKANLWYILFNHSNQILINKTLASRNINEKIVSQTLELVRLTIYAMISAEQTRKKKDKIPSRLEPYETNPSYLAAELSIKSIELMFGKDGQLNQYQEEFHHILKSIQSDTAEQNLSTILNGKKQDSNITFDRIRAIRLFQYLIATAKLNYNHIDDSDLTQICNHIRSLDKSVVDFGSLPHPIKGLKVNLGSLLEVYVGLDYLGHKLSTRLLFIFILISGELITETSKQVVIATSKSSINGVIQSPIDTHQQTRATNKKTLDDQAPEVLVPDGVNPIVKSAINTNTDQYIDVTKVKKLLFGINNSQPNLIRIITILKTILTQDKIQDITPLEYEQLAITIAWYDKITFYNKGKQFTFMQLIDSISSDQTMSIAIYLESATKLAKKGEEATNHTMFRLLSLYRANN